MSKLRKIYKGEENWDCLYENQDEILKAGINPKKVDENKSFVEDNPEAVANKPKDKNNVNSIARKLDNVIINNAAIDNDNIITEDDRGVRIKYEVNDDDYDNFDYNYDIEEDVNPRKRQHDEAMGDDYDIMVEEAKRAKMEEY
jgi:hypothetical protein